MKDDRVYFVTLAVEAIQSLTNKVLKGETMPFRFQGAAVNKRQAITEAVKLATSWGLTVKAVVSVERKGII